MGSLSARIAEPLRWARRNGWSPRYPRTRREGLHTWVDAERRITVRLDVSGHLQVYQRRTSTGSIRILDAQVGCWQQVLDALTIHRLLPPQFNTAYNHDDGDSEWQWGVRTTYTDGSFGIDWTNQDDAESFLIYYAEADHRPEMRVQTRELVRRRIVPRQVRVQPSSYVERRVAAEMRVAARRPSTPVADSSSKEG